MPYDPNQPRGPAGVYEIRNIQNGHRYIGGSIDIIGRFHDHKLRLQKGAHRNKPLQRAWLKYGEGNFIFRVLLYCGPEMVFFYEQVFLDKLVTRVDYNMSKYADAPMRGRKFSEEHKQRLSASHIGHSISDKHKQRLSEVHKGHKYNLGRIHTEETKRKISTSLKGNHNALGSYRTEEIKRKMSEAKKGRKHTKEARQNMSIAKIKWWKKRHATI